MIRRGNKKILIGDKLVTVQIDFDGSIGKYCNMLKKFLPPEEFFIVKSEGSGIRGGTYRLSPYSKEGSKLQTRAWRDRRRMKHLICGIRARAKRGGKECTITENDIKLETVCPIFGIPLDDTYGPRSRNSSSLDRVDNSKGYIPGNVIMCSWRANTRKNDMSFEEVEKLYFFMKNFLGK